MATVTTDKEVVHCKIDTHKWHDILRLHKYKGFERYVDNGTRRFWESDGSDIYDCLRQVAAGLGKRAGLNTPLWAYARLLDISEENPNVIGEVIEVVYRQKRMF